MLQELIHTKINEIFAEYQKANNIISGKLLPEDARYLEQLEFKLEAFVEGTCKLMRKGINYDDFAPSWYVYTDCDGDAHSDTFNGDIREDYFFHRVSYAICFSDCEEITVHKIYFRGKEVIYAGWQPGMRFEYKDLDGNTIWVGDFPHWDH